MENPKLKMSQYSVEFHFPNGFVYDINWEFIKTERGINEWIAHLAEKNWWSEKLESELVSAWKQRNSNGKRENN